MNLIIYGSLSGYEGYEADIQLPCKGVNWLFTLHCYISYKLRIKRRAKLKIPYICTTLSYY
jgi:hypothetical protein